MNRAAAHRSIAVWLGTLLLTVLPATAAVAAPAQDPEPEDPALAQRIAQDQAVGTGTAVLDRGHVDLGPAYVEGEWSLMIHDDAAEPPVWRHPEEAVLRIGDEAMVQVPDDPTYSFLGAAAGESVHVVSQTQQPDVVWIGWNTQHPEVMERIDRGVTLTLLGVQGPGQLSVYLQSGNFGAPQVLWSSAEDAPQPIWVDVNTHTHANWVFTEPGTYLVRVAASADLLDGSTETSVADLRVAVGGSADPADALALTPDADLSDAVDDGRGASAETGTEAGPGQADGPGEAGASPALLLAVVAAVVLGAAVTFAVVRSRRTRAEAARRAAGSPT
jgi:putative ABC transporter-associated repeat protein